MENEGIIWLFEYLVFKLLDSIKISTNSNIGETRLLDVPSKVL